MNDTVKHLDDEAIVSLTYTWGMVGGFLLEHGRPATDPQHRSVGRRLRFR